MNRILMLCVGALLFVLGIGLGPVLSQEMGGEAEEGEACGECGDACAEDPIEAWREFQKPGEPHKVLEKMAGEWDLAIRMWLEPGAEPQEYKSEGEMEMTYGGRFLTGEYEMDQGPFPHKGTNWMGYNNTTKQYECLSITDGDTGMYFYKGEYDDEAATLTVKSEFKVMWGEQEMDARQRLVYTFESDDRFKLEVFTSYVGMPGIPEEGIKEVEIVHTRKKDG